MEVQHGLADIFSRNGAAPAPASNEVLWCGMSRGADLAESLLSLGTPAFIAKGGIVGVVPTAFLSQPLLSIHSLETAAARARPSHGAWPACLHWQLHALAIVATSICLPACTVTPTTSIDKRPVSADC